MIESIKIDIGLVVGDSDDCDFCCPFIRNKEPFTAIFRQGRQITEIQHSNSGGAESLNQNSQTA